MDQNKERVDTERASYDKLMASFNNVSEDVKLNLEAQLKNIELQDKEAQRLVEKEKAAAEGKEEAKDS